MPEQYPWIEESLWPLAVPISQLREDPDNVRRHTEKSLSAIRASLLIHKQQKPVVVDQDGVVIAGNGVLMSAKALQWTHLAVVRTTLVDAKRKAYAISDNRIAELSTWDVTRLDEALREIQAEASINISHATGFRETEIKALLKKVAAPDPAAKQAAGPETSHFIEIHGRGDFIRQAYPQLQKWAALQGVKIVIQYPEGGRKRERVQPEVPSGQA